MNGTDFVLMLHSHLPWVLNHGRWPHGSDWLCEAALDCYLPLLETLHVLERDGIPAPVTIGLTPVLANQLVSPAFATEMEQFLEVRLAACDEAPASLAATGDQALLPLVAFWRARLTRLRDLFRALDGNIVGALAGCEARGRIEITGSAATHGFLPLLRRRESVRFQLAVGVAEHTRLLGRAPRGCWLPECGYRPGIEAHLSAVGFGYTFVDTHLLHAGEPLGAYTDIPLGAERFDAERHDVAPTAGDGAPARSPYKAYRVAGSPSARPVAVMARDPRSSLQVWSRHQGYPGDAAYLEFHKIRWPGGLKLWRVTGPDLDLGDKQPYDPAAAAERMAGHADHFAALLRDIATAPGGSGGGERPAVIVSPFDTELFGHWWFEGVDFLGGVYRRLRGRGPVRPATASAHLDRGGAPTRIRLGAGSWGAGGDDRMWLNDATRPLWRRLWALEDAFWDVAPQAHRTAARAPILEAAARALLLAQSSDWPFIISTGAAGDYAELRFARHCGEAEQLVAALRANASPPELAAAHALAGTLAPRDTLFPDLLPALASVLATT